MTFAGASLLALSVWGSTELFCNYLSERRAMTRFARQALRSRRRPDGEPDEHEVVTDIMEAFGCDVRPAERAVARALGLVDFKAGDHRLPELNDRL